MAYTPAIKADQERSEATTSSAEAVASAAERPARTMKETSGAAVLPVFSTSSTTVRTVESDMSGRAAPTFMLPQQLRIEIGRRGEEKVYEFLKQKHIEKYGSVNVVENEEGYKITTKKGSKTVKWLNKTTESGKPYDFEVVVIKKAKQTSRYLEVKATATPGDRIEINYSAKEWQTMQDYELAKISYRLYLVGFRGEEVLLRKHNLIEELSKGTARVTDYKKVLMPGF
jgi:hypothetical protein